MDDANDTPQSTNPVVNLLRAVGKNGPTAGSYRVLTILFSMSLTIVSFFGYRALSQYDDRQQQILVAVQENAIQIATLSATVNSKSSERDRQIHELVDALNVLRVTIGEIEKRETTVEGRMSTVEGEMQYWRSPASNERR